MSGTIVERTPSGIDTDWCDCAVLDWNDVAWTAPHSKESPSFHRVQSCGGWVSFPLSSVTSGLRPHTNRPRDRVVAPPIKRSFNPAFFQSYDEMVKKLVAEKAAIVASGLNIPMKPWVDPDRQFDGFCNPCGGFRNHKRGCPVGTRPN